MLFFATITNTELVSGSKHHLNNITVVHLKTSSQKG